MLLAVHIIKEQERPHLEENTRKNQQLEFPITMALYFDHRDNNFFKNCKERYADYGEKKGLKMK